MRLVIDGQLHEVKLPNYTKRAIISNVLSWGLVAGMMWGLIQLALRAISQ